MGSGAGEAGSPGRGGLTPWTVEGDWRRCAVEIGTDACLDGTDRPLTGVLFAYVDVVTGSPPSGAMNPTVDLQLRLFSPPRRGRIGFRARTLRLGRTLYVGEVELRHDDDGEPFGTALATFMNQPVPFPERAGTNPASASPTYGPLREAQRRSPGCFSLEADIDTPQGTVAGATLGRLAELAAMDRMGGAAAVDELEVRFLHKIKRGPLVATATVVGRRDGATTARVEVVDTGDANRLVTYALAVCRRVSPAG